MKQNEMAWCMCSHARIESAKPGLKRRHYNGTRRPDVRLGTMRVRRTFKVLGKRMLKYYRVSWCWGCARAAGRRLARRDAKVVIKATGGKGHPSAEI